jgi:hypothetical protein
LVLSTRAGVKAEAGDVERDSAAPLRARITYLGRLVGEVLQTHARPRTFEHVERLRSLTRRRRAEPGAQLDAEIDAVLDALATDDAVDVIRAFGLYFRMVNLAEQLHRERRRRERALAGEDPLRGSIETLESASAADLEQLEISLVFTAHPTEVLRRTTAEKIMAIARLLRDLDERMLTPEEKLATEVELRAQIVQSPARSASSRRASGPFLAKRNARRGFRRIARLRRTRSCHLPRHTLRARTASRTRTLSAQTRVRVPALGAHAGRRPGRLRQPRGIPRRSRGDRREPESAQRP